MKLRVKFERSFAAVFPCAAVSVFLWLLAAPPPCIAQPDAPDSSDYSSTLTITSNPPGALVVLEGEHTVRGRAPFSIARKLAGRYRVSAYAPGYEEWHSTLYLDPVKNRTLAIDLSRKSRWKAVLRSTIFPGWGQNYSGQKTKSIVFGTLGAGTLAWSTVEHIQYKNSVDDLHAAMKAYQDSNNSEDLPRLSKIVEQKRAIASRKFDQRRIAVYATGAVWAVNILDAFIFYPSTSQGFYSQIGSGGEMIAGFRMEF